MNKEEKHILLEAAEKIDSHMKMYSCHAISNKHLSKRYTEFFTDLSSNAWLDKLYRDFGYEEGKSSYDLVMKEQRKFRVLMLLLFREAGK